MTTAPPPDPPPAPNPSAREYTCSRCWFDDASIRGPLSRRCPCCQAGHPGGHHDSCDHPDTCDWPTDAAPGTDVDVTAGTDVALVEGADRAVIDPPRTRLPEVTLVQRELLGSALTHLHSTATLRARGCEATMRRVLMYGDGWPSGPVAAERARREALEHRTLAVDLAELAELLGVGIEGDGPDEDPT